LKGFLGFLVFVFLNIILCIIFSIKRQKFSQKIDLMAILLSAITATIFFHVLATIEDIKSVQWVMISVPIAFIVGLLISFITSIVFQGYLMKKNRMK
jgi:hypothetical protein